MPDVLAMLAYGAVTRLVGPQQWARQPDLLHAMATHDLRRLVRALVASEASAHLLLAPLTDWPGNQVSATVLQQVVAGDLAALLWAATPDPHPLPLLAVEVEHLTLETRQLRTLLNTLLVLVVTALHDGAQVCSVRLRADPVGVPPLAVLTLESDRPGLHGQPRARQHLTSALDALPAAIAYQHWGEPATWITTVRLPLVASPAPQNGKAAYAHDHDPTADPAA